MTGLFRGLPRIHLDAPGGHMTLTGFEVGSGHGDLQTKVPNTHGNAWVHRCGHLSLQMWSSESTQMWSSESTSSKPLSEYPRHTYSVSQPLPYHHMYIFVGIGTPKALEFAATCQDFTGFML